MKAARVLKFHQEGSIQKWQVIIPAEHNEGKRWFRRFQTKKEAEAFADKFSRDPFGTVAELRGLKTAARPTFLARNDRDNAEYIWKHLVAKFATNSVAEGIKAIDYYFDNHSVNHITVADAVREYHAHRATVALNHRTLAEDRIRLSKLVAQFGASELASITTQDLRDFFDRIPKGHDGTATNKISFRNKIGPFFLWAHEEAKYLRENPIESISKKSLGTVGVNKDYYTPEVFLRMLRITAGVEPVTEGGEKTTEFRDTLYPWFVGSGFLGIRTDEIIGNKASDHRVRWSDCKFDTAKDAHNAHVHIRREVGKGGKEGRIEADFAIAAFQAWLPKPQEDDFICPASRHQIQAAKARFTKLTGIELPDNGFRNSFATYCRSHMQSAVLAAEQLRNNVSVANKNYITILPRTLGETYFGLRPLAVVEKVA
jgi:hypothetical protein